METIICYLKRDTTIKEQFFMRQNVKNFIKYKDLLIQLIIQDIKLKYKNSVLGILWSMLDPLLTMIVLSIIFGAIFKRDIPNFPVYVLIGRLVYSFFSQSTNGAMEAVLANKQLIKKIYVPKYFFPLAKVCSTFITFLISFIPLIGVMLVTGVSFHQVNFLVVLPLIYLFMISLGIGLILCTVRVFFGDIKHLYSVLLLLVMYMTPIFYPPDIIANQFIVFVNLNPLFTLLNMFRDILMYQTVPNMAAHLICLSYSLIYLVAGFLVFYKAQDKFILHV